MGLFQSHAGYDGSHDASEIIVAGAFEALTRISEDSHEKLSRNGGFESFG
jgi:hypothetical protein